MRKITFYISGILLIAAASGCKKYLDVNHNPSAQNSVPEADILAPVEASVSSLIYGGGSSMLVNAWVQNVSQNQETPNSDTYQVQNNSFDGYWTDYYVTTMNNDYLLIKEANGNGNHEYAGIGQVLMAFTLGNATDLWGDIPYSQAFQGTVVATPKYDAQDTIYLDLQALLDSAIVNLSNATPGHVPGGDDFFYGGDEGHWIRAAYLLKARYYMHLTKAPGYSATTQATLALAALQNAMASNSDDMSFPYAGTATAQNPLYQNYGPISTSTSVLCATLVDSLVDRNDPRLAALVAGAPGTGLDSGRTAGASGVLTLADFSTPGAFYGNAGSSTYVLNYTEALFLKAEAELIISGVGAAQQYYRQGITTHMIKVGLDTTSASCKAYLAARGTLPASNPYQFLMTEKDIANYMSNENWVDWRRTGYPSLTIIPGAVTSTIPRRYLYPLDELTSNPQPQQSALITDRVWWDAQ
ncbi:SusD/RagB family nutrient-binding outer membrane lipoprotein [Dinghuibacter silviterrae]|uniref:SusD-like starch-binding protein associating with outer membrane n=1 Tax=Dinghuibacter silviterrae TaxID=1539049 RepID=A0A4R8DTJ4_9BACT|nr:SusD/RagB family nutrient-binding outer membrane lipoprotein [Dinghuibacter silviterrae]TDX01226.1 SusD-like starch-binding protein associating with outer membrane [Dinghuibacter silviterrae]